MMCATNRIVCLAPDRSYPGGIGGNKRMIKFKGYICTETLGWAVLSLQALARPALTLALARLTHSEQCQNQQ
jgi:hypothetical protein